MERIENLLKDVKIDKERVKKSVDMILHLLDIGPKDIRLSRKKIDPSEIYVAAVEECNLKDAKRIMKEEYSSALPAPITVLDFRGKYVLFMGSNRSIIFVLKGQIPDCIVVKIPENRKEPKMVSEAKKTLKEIIEKQK